MESTGPHIDKTNTTFYFLYRCWKCILKNVVGIKTEAEARMSIAESSSGHINRKERNAKFKSCVERVAENFPRATSRSEKAKLARDYMQKVFEGYKEKNYKRARMAVMCLIEKTEWYARGDAYARNSRIWVSSSCMTLHPKP